MAPAPSSRRGYGLLWAPGGAGTADAAGQLALPQHARARQQQKDEIAGQAEIGVQRARVEVVRQDAQAAADDPLAPAGDRIGRDLAHRIGSLEVGKLVAAGETQVKLEVLGPANGAR